ncbi:MAG: TGS domain-containing protein [Planctomycetota bacterium]|jgi:ribosome-interacting GTPase 1
MPANLTPQYFSAEERYKAAKTPEERIEALEEMLAVIPKHKGTDKLQGDLKKRLAKLKASQEKKKGPGGKVNPYKIDRFGAGIITMIGPSNSGKSSILKALSNAEPEVAPYLYTTRVPMPGIISFDNAKMTLVDTPPITADYRDPDLSGFLRKTDLTLLVLDPLDPELLDGLEAVINSLAEVKISLAPEATMAGPGRPVKLKTMAVANKIDLDGASDTVELLKELYPDFRYLLISAETGEGLDEFTRELFFSLDVVRAYTKKPGKKPEFNDPVYLKRGQTVIDFARDIHKDFADGLKFARIWGEGKHDGQNVSRDHQVNDGDIIELHL